jgi:hypothetical protein
LPDLGDMLAILKGSCDAENATGGVRLVALEIGARAVKIIKEAAKSG